MKAVIMAGGKGTRLRSIMPDVPKPMFLIADKPILEYQIESLREFGITEIIIVVGHLGQVIRDYFGNGSGWGVSISYIEEKIPLGTAGALYYLKGICKESFLLIFGDLILDIDWGRFLRFHIKTNGLITVFSHPNSHPHDSDVLCVDPEGRVVSLYRKNQERPRYYHNLVNAGVYMIKPELLESFCICEKLDMEKDIIECAIKTGQVFAYRSTDYIKDMGTPERYRHVENDILRGIVKNKNLAKKQKCIFLDRDGTVNEWNGIISSLDQMELIPGAGEAIKRINETDFLAIIITNQPVIARGECTLEELDQIHRKMETLLGQHGAYIDDLFFCPHHPDGGFENERLEYKVICKCRKPGIEMLLQASGRYNIDLSESWFVGDTTVDVRTGKNAGMHTILLDTGEGGRDGKYDVTPDYRAADLMEAVKIILKEQI